MLQTRLIPCLLLKGKGLVKTIQFQSPKYIGDPINAVRIFNSKEVDELIFLDIEASSKWNILKNVKREKYIIELISKISDECFMPLTFGGGINTVDRIKELLNAGVEKISLNTHAIENPIFVKDASDIFGSQSIVISIDIKKLKNGSYEVYTHGGTKSTGVDPVNHAINMANLGAGEILLNSIDRDGTMEGYDTDIIKKVSDSVNIPVIACGGAGKMDDFAQVVNVGNASAAAAGSFFVFHGKKRAVLISYPNNVELGNFLNQGRK